MAGIIFSLVSNVTGGENACSRERAERPCHWESDSQKPESKMKKDKEETCDRQRHAKGSEKAKDYHEPTYSCNTHGV